MGEELKAIDYINRPMLELMSHPDYSEEAFQIIARISNMTSAQIEQINLGGNQNG